MTDYNSISLLAEKAGPRKGSFSISYCRCDLERLVLTTHVATKGKLLDFLVRTLQVELPRAEEAISHLDREGRATIAKKQGR